MEVVMLMGFPASGKSTVREEYTKRGFVVLNRDTEGGKVEDLIPSFRRLLDEGKSVVLDNTFLSVASRKPFVSEAAARGVPVDLLWMQTSIEDSQVNACSRMYDRYGTVFLDNTALKAHAKAANDPNMFPLAAFFAAKKRLDGDKKKNIPSGKPTKDEGFRAIKKVPFVRRSSGTRKAIILDYDGTLRADAKEHGGEHPYPIKPSEVHALPRRREVLQKYLDEGYLLLGVTTQSGIGKGHLTEADARACIEETNRQIGLDIETLFCPHYNFPVACYCRKPLVGLGVQLIKEYDLDPAQCIMVGDMKTDETFAQRCGFQFQYADRFFA